MRISLPPIFTLTKTLANSHLRPAVSPNGKYIVTASGDGTARVYVVHLEDLITLAQSWVTRVLTCAERVQYLREDIVCPTPTP